MLLWVNPCHVFHLRGALPLVASYLPDKAFHFQIAANTESRRDTGSKALRKTITSRSEIKMFRKFVVCLPHISEHKNHEMVEVS